MKEKQKYLAMVAQRDKAEHSARLGLEHLRFAATEFELAGHVRTAAYIRKTIENIRTRMAGGGGVK